MKFECRDLESTLRGQDDEQLEAAAVHAETCPQCRAQLQLWNEISAAAKLLHRSWDSPGLWPRIHQALAAESQQPPREPMFRRMFAGLGNWQALMAGLALLLILGAGTWTIVGNLGTPTEQEEDGRLLTESAVSEVEKAEAAYIRSIERLSKVVAPRVQRASSPILVSYREKLILIDAAIAACQANIESNRFNAHLRSELLTIYKDKEATLLSVMREGKNAQN
jgi:anti-sigma factor RsiW